MVLGIEAVCSDGLLGGRCAESVHSTVWPIQTLTDSLPHYRYFSTAQRLLLRLALAVAGGYRAVGWDADTE